MSKIYYLEKTKKREGVHERIIDVAARDKKRKEFEDRIKNDLNFKNRVLRWTKKKPEEYVAEFRKRIAPGGDYIKSAKQQMCTKMYSLGTWSERNDKGMVKVKKADGEEELWRQSTEEAACYKGSEEERTGKWRGQEATQVSTRDCGAAGNPQVPKVH